MNEKIYQDLITNCSTSQQAIERFERLYKGEPEDALWKASALLGAKDEQKSENLFLRNRKFLNSDEKYEFPKIKFICKDLGLYKGPPASLIGESGGSKTAIASLLALCVASGTDFLGMKVSKGKVIWIDYEQGLDMVEVKFRRLMNGHKIKINEKELSFSEPITKLSNDYKIIDELVKATTGIDFAVIDCLRGGSGISENESTARDPLDMLRIVSEKTNCTFLVIHHTGKTNKEQSRGSSALKDAVGTELLVMKSSDKTTYKLSQNKHRLQEFRGIKYRFEDFGEEIENIGMKDSVKIVPIEENNFYSEIQNKIIAVLSSGSLTGTILNERVGGKKEKYSEDLKYLIENNIVKCEKDGTYKVYSLVDMETK